MGNIDIRTALQRANADSVQRQALERQQQMIRQQQDKMLARQRDLWIQQFITDTTRMLYLEELKHKGTCTSIESEQSKECRLGMIDQSYQLALEFAERLGMVTLQKQEKQDETQT